MTPYTAYIAVVSDCCPIQQFVYQPKSGIWRNPDPFYNVQLTYEVITLSNKKEYAVHLSDMDWRLEAKTKNEESLIIRRKCSESGFVHVYSTIKTMLTLFEISS